MAKLQLVNGKLVSKKPTTAIEEQISLYRTLAESKGIKLPEEKKPKTSFLNRIFDVLRTGEYAVGGLLTGKGVMGGIKEKISPSKALGISTEKTPLLSPRGVAGLAADIILDPTTYLTFGAGGAVKVATKTGQKVALNKAGEKLFYKTVKELGEDAGRKKIAETLVQEGAEKYLAKTGLKFLGAEIVPRKVFTKAGGITEKVISKTPVVGGAYKTTKEVLKGAFQPFAKIKELPEGEKYISGLQRLAKGTRAEIFESSEQIGKMAKETQRIVGKDGSSTILDLIETGYKVTTKQPFLERTFKKEAVDQLMFSDVTRKAGEVLSKVDFSKVKTSDEALKLAKQSIPKKLLTKEVKTTIEGMAKTAKMAKKPFEQQQMIDTVFEYISKGHKEIAKIEKEKGLLKGELDDYVRHLLTPKGREFVKSGGTISSELTKPLRTKLGAGKERKLIGTVKEINEKMRERVGGDLFESNVFKAFAYRKAESIKAVNIDNFLGWVGKEFGEDVPRITDEGIKYIESTAPQLKGKFIPAPIAKHIDETMKFLSNDESTSAFLRTYDKLLSFWKGTVTGYFPSFHTRNALGGSFNNWLAGVKVDDYKISHKILSGQDGVLKTKIGDIPYSQIRKELKELGVIGQPGYLDVVKNVDDFLSTSITGKIKKLPRGAMEIVENNIRTPLYINRRILGESGEEALGQVLKFHFDYMPEGLTAFEKGVMRRLIPFYRWTRGNIPLQIENLITQPGKYASLAKSIDNMSQDVSDEELTILPEYMQESLPIKIPDSIAKMLGGTLRVGNVNYIYGLGIPAEDINKLWKGDLRRTIEGIMSESSPLIKTPIELTTGRNMFFGSPIEDFDTAPSFLDKAPEPLKEWLGFAKIEYKDKEGNLKTKFTAEPRKLFFIQSVLSRGWMTADKLTSPDYTNAMKIGYSLANLKVRSVDLEYQEYLAHRKIRDEIEKELERRGVLKSFTKYYEPKEEKKIKLK